MQRTVSNSATILRSFERLPENGIPPRVLPVVAVYTYSRSKGLFAGVSLEGTVLVTQNDKNAVYHGKGATTAAILSGRLSPPAGASRLLAALNRY